jgi:hypothetical protein
MVINKGYALVFLLSCFFLTAQTGIGTTTPVNKLQVETATAEPATTGLAANGNLRLSGTTGTQVLDFGVGTTTYSWLQSRSKSAYGTNYYLALNPNGGWVGVGTAVPLTTLTVGNAAGTVPGEITLNPTSPTAGEGGQITLKKSLQGGTVDWTIDQVGTSSANARLRIFGGSSETSGLAILENGNVGIGYINPTTKLYVNGDITANSVAGTSDRRFKTNIRPVDNALAKVKALQGVYFNWNQKEFPEKEFGSQDELGFIAQEVEKIVPEIVVKEKSKEEYRSVKYDKLVALLVEAIKEQQKQIEGLRNQVKRIKRNKK